MKMGYSEEVSKYHAKLAAAMAPHKGQQLGNQQIMKVLLNTFPAIRPKQDWILPSDHCKNHTCKGACYCTMTDGAIFNRIGHSKYLVL